MMLWMLRLDELLDLGLGGGGLETSTSVNRAVRVLRAGVRC
jgi:hypothetical protein